MRDILKRLSKRELEILDLIQKRGSFTKKDLQVLTDIKLTTLNRAMKSLEDKRLIVEVGTSESTGGRKAVEYAVAERGTYVIGIDLSRTHVRIILLNLKMNILKNEEFSLDYSFTPENTVEKIAYLIEKILVEHSIDKNEVLGIGIGTVGPLDRELGIILNPKGFFNENWSNVHLKEMMENKISIPCFLDNGANTAVLAEYFLGKGKGLKTVVYIHCGVGIRSAVITDGIIIRTMNDSEDAFAHMIIDARGEDCICGNRGCIEGYSSIEAIVKRYNSFKKERKKDSVKEEHFEMLMLASQNDNAALQVINEGAEALGIGLANLVRILNPQLVILSGPLIINYTSYYDKSIEVFRKNNCFNNKVTFSNGGEFQENVIAVGAGLMVIEHFFKK